MRAAIYARKSNEEKEKNPANKSVHLQVEEARRYAEKKGWTVSEEHIYFDDGVSGADFGTRRGFGRLLASLPKRGSRQNPPFDVLIMSELSRLGRDVDRTPGYVADILDSNVRVFYYLSDAEERGDSPEAKLMKHFRAYSDEAYRIRTGERVRSRLARMAQQGLVTGGTVYGYKAEAVVASVNGQQMRSHSEWRIDQAEAEVIRSIFRAYADGYGHASIAKALNADPRPRYEPLSRRYFEGQRVTAPRNGGGAWAASSVREILHRDRYVGRLRFGRMRNDWKHGTKQRRPGAETDVVVVERPDLRIVPDGLWREVQGRIASVKKTYVRSTGGKLWGRPGMGVESRYLLSGLGRCGCCGANITAVGGFPGKAHRRPIYYYGCSWFANKGVSVCSNALRVRMERADEVVREAMKREALTPEAVERILDYAEAMLTKQRQATADRPAKLEAELRRAQRERDNFMKLIGEGKAPASVLDRVRALDETIAALEQRLADRRLEPPSELDRARLRKLLRQRLGEFDDLIRADVPLARQALRKLLDGPITFEPAAEGYLFRGRTKVGALISKAYIGMVPRKGLEPPQCCHRMDLNHVRLPIPPPRQGSGF